MKAFIGIFLGVLLFVGLGFFLFRASEKPIDPSEQPGETFENQGATHIADGTTGTMTYNSNPPTSGNHWPAAAPWGVYDNAEPDERYIHNLEHGGIWISYKPSLPAEQVNQLKDFARRYRKVVVTPREANDSNIALAAWTHLQKLESYDEQAILKFIEAYYDQGPEKVP